MATLDAIRKITIQASTPGVSQSTSELNNLVAAQNRVAASADQLRLSMEAVQKLVDDNVSKLNALKSANDNAAGSFSGVAHGAADVTGSFADTVEHTLNLINHFKLLGLAAYAISPAFRSVINSGIPVALGLIPPAATKAASSILSFAGPALSFFGRIAVPIGGAVLAWEGLNAVINTGSSLLDKYGDAERKLYAPNVDSDLQKLTRFQNDTISPEQAQQATELASALAEAKRNISDFLKVQIDLTEPALKLQSAWVAIVSLIGKAAAAANNMSLPDSNVGNSGFFQAFEQWSKTHGIWGGGLGSLPGTMPTSPASDLLTGKGDNANADANSSMRLARARLSAGMSGGFPGYYSQEISDLVKPPKPDAPDNSTDAYQRSIQSIKDKIAVLQQEADGAGKTSRAVEEMKVADEANIAAMKAGIKPTEEMRAEWKKYGDDISDLTIKINQAKVEQSETFKRDTMFMSPSDTAAANAAHQIDPTNWKAHMGDQGPQMAAMNAQLTQVGGLADSFGESFAQSMIRGEGATRSLSSAINSLESSLVSLIAKAAVNKMIGSLVGMSGPAAGVSGTANPTILGSLYAYGGVFDRGLEIHPFASGGIVDRATVFPMANGAGLMGEAGPEAVMPLTRMSGGKLGVKTNGASGGHTFHITTPVNVTVPHGTSPEDASKMASSFGRQARDMVTQRVHEILIEQTRSGGLLNP